MTNSDLAAPLFLASLYHEEYRPPFLPVLQQLSPCFLLPAFLLPAVSTLRTILFPSVHSWDISHNSVARSRIESATGCSRNSLLRSKWGGWKCRIDYRKWNGLSSPVWRWRRNALSPMEPAFASRYAITRRTRSRSMFSAARIVRVCAIFWTRRRNKQFESKKRAKQVHD